MIARPTLGSLPHTRSSRGQPLVIMLAVLALWAGLRAGLWAPAIDGVGGGATFAGANAASLAIRKVRGQRGDDAHSPIGRVLEPRSGATAAWRFLAVTPGADRPPWRASSGPAMFEPADTGLQVLAPSSSAMRSIAIQPRMRTASPSQIAIVPIPVWRDGSVQAPRLSLDAWLFLRAGGSADLAARPLAPTYGRSQFGSVVRHSFGPATPLAPEAYLRATGAIDSREADLAAGFSVRPVPALPLRAHGEVRLSRLGERVELRPSAFVTAGLDETVNPLAIRLRGYAQAGYVGGAFATAFADGSLVAERAVTRSERGALSAGVGAWGGAQRGTARLDAGPSVSYDFPIGRGSARLAADYRFRVAGDAVPSSGAALTLSTSF